MAKSFRSPVSSLRYRLLLGVGRCYPLLPQVATITAGIRGALLTATDTMGEERIWKSFLGGVGLVVLALVAAILFNTLNVESQSVPVSSTQAAIAIDESVAAIRLARAVQYRTVSVSSDMPAAGAAFRGLHEYLESSFPRVRDTLTRETINGYSLLYTWQGKDPSLKPILLAAHMDVVPVEPGTEDDWLHPPFAGKIADGFVWGRGTMDMKASIFGSLEAIEYLIGRGFTPDRTVDLAFGLDEVIGGDQCAAKIA